MRMLVAPRTGMVGKAPCHADFIRIHASSPLALGLHRWLADGVEASRAARCELPSEVTALLFTMPGDKSVLAAGLAPSKDGVGRDFPLAVFAELPASVVASHLGALPAVLRPFLSGAAELLRASTALELPALTRRVEVLPLPRTEDFTAARGQCQDLLAGRRVTELLAPLSHPSEPPGSPYYALHTLLVACAGERQRQQAPANVILECPLVEGLGPAAWLELVSRLLRWPSTPPSFAWCGGAEPRLLLCLGATAPDLFLHLTRPGQGSARLWPLRTTRTAAIEHARQSLSTAQRQCIDSPTTSLQELLHTLSR
jgi:type VI secretion system protein ImpM